MQIKEFLYDFIQIFVICILLTFYMIINPSSDSDCDVNSHIVFTLNTYIDFSLVTFFVISLTKSIIRYYFRNKVVLNIIIITISYALILFVTVGGIFIAQQMNIEQKCYNFFESNKNIFCIFISIMILSVVNIIYGCIECNTKQKNNNFDNENEYLINQSYVKPKYVYS